MFHSRLGCSSISFRYLPLPEALATIDRLGFEEIDLGALPGICDHVPYELDESAVEQVAAQVAASGLRVRSVNGDVGDLNVPLDPEESRAREEHLERLLSLTAALGARALVLPCGWQEHEPFRSLEEDIRLVADQLIRAADRAKAHGVELWTESLHFFRLCHDTERAQLLADALSGTDVGIVMDFSHVTASGGDPRDFVARFGPAIRHVHIRDAVPGNIHISVGRGAADFAGGFEALRQTGYQGHVALELETRDITDPERADGAVAAANHISPLI